MKEVDTLTEEESRNIEELLEKKKALENLLKILSERQGIYKKVYKDYKDILEKYDNWWENTSYKFMGENDPSSFLSLDFKTRKIYLIDG